MLDRSDRSRSITVVRNPPSLDDATHSASQGFVVEESEHLRQDVMNHLGDGDVYTIKNAAANSCGFAIVRRHPGHILYICGIMLVPEMQGMGHASTIIRAVCTPEDRFLALRTQSPIMWAAGQKICDGRWLPHETFADPELSDIGREIAVRTKTTFPVHPGFYGGALYGEKPIHRDGKIQAWWDSLCNFARGDAVICVGRL